MPPLLIMQTKCVLREMGEFPSEGHRKWVTMWITTIIGLRKQDIYSPLTKTEPGFIPGLRLEINSTFVKTGEPLKTFDWRMKTAGLKGDSFLGQYHMSASAGINECETCMVPSKYKHHLPHASKNCVLHQKYSILKTEWILSDRSDL
ncbi:hypothetical protein J437_LFUL006823 [Ladona fulva]|uniref:Uncharacterized protein n=1 Tax=Ladona fulva TaxID=123851 RepID=A0A8K0NY10_LADFU|nr:hypothetical protein J437_LFUL006823 [Ladona fulva]